MKSIKFFTVTKNEYDILEDWIVYHGVLAGGFENIIVIDNGSDDRRILDIYKRYEGLIKLEIRGGYHNDNQGHHFTEIMYKYKENTDIIMGLDTDEFLVKLRGEEIDVRPDEILGELNTFPNELAYGMIKTHINSCSYGKNRFIWPCYEINKFVNNRSKNSKNYNGPKPKYNKAFYRGNDFVETYNGNHDGRTISGKGIWWPELALLHFHDLGWERNMERARQTVLGYDYINNNDDNKEIIKKLGRLGNDCYGCHRVAEYLRFVKDNKQTFNQEHNYETWDFANYLNKIQPRL